MSTEVLLIVGLSDGGEATERALAYAREASRGVLALLVLNSHLYHYGHNDVIVPGYARTQFLLHIQEQIAQQGAARTAALQQRAAECGVALRVLSVETEDPIPVILRIAARGYEGIFVSRKPRRIFPLFEKTLERQLRKAFSTTVVAC
jgi:hypothetical protein